jgi:hypothetical protein
MNHYTLRKTTLDAVAYFDRMATSGQFAGFPALALAHTADKFGIPQPLLRQTIEAVRHNERLASRP